MSASASNTADRGRPNDRHASRSTTDSVGHRLERRQQRTRGDRPASAARPSRCHRQRLPDRVGRDPRRRRSTSAPCRSARTSRRTLAIRNTATGAGRLRRGPQRELRYGVVGYRRRIAHHRKRAASTASRPAATSNAPDGRRQHQQRPAPSTAASPINFFSGRCGRRRGQRTRLAIAVGSAGYGVMGMIAEHGQRRRPGERPVVNNAHDRARQCPHRLDLAVGLRQRRRTRRPATSRRLSTPASSGNAPVTASGSFNLTRPEFATNASQPRGRLRHVDRRLDRSGAATIAFVSDASNIGNCAPNCQDHAAVAERRRSPARSTGWPIPSLPRRPPSPSPDACRQRVAGVTAINDDQRRRPTVYTEGTDRLARRDLVRLHVVRQHHEPGRGRQLERRLGVTFEHRDGRDVLRQRRRCNYVSTGAGTDRRGRPRDRRAAASR